jgi:methionyl-tRNA formyltransferase
MMGSVRRAPGEIKPVKPWERVRMPDEIVLLTGEREGPYLIEHLRNRAPSLAVRHAASRADLDAAFQNFVPRRRLIAFTTNIVVPGRYIDACEAGAYNFHPGPPSYPGVYPESFAVWDGAARFGATAHAMVKRVDAGPIVRADWFDIEPGWGRMHVATLAFQALVRIFADLAPLLAAQEAPLAPSGEAWCGPTRFRKEYDAMCAITPDMPAGEYKRRYRAFGEGPFRDFHIVIHGHRFTIENPWTDADLAREMNAG